MEPPRSGSGDDVAVCLAGAELRERVRSVLGDAGKRPIVLTAAGLAGRLVRDRGGMAVADIPGLELLREDPALKDTRTPWAASLVLIVPDDSRPDLRRALRAGAGALLVAHRIDTLPAVLTVAREGHLCVPGSMRQPLSRAVLSQRERQALALAITGLTNAEVATRLFVAPSTVKTHLSAAFQKLGVRSRAEAAALVHDPDEGLTELIFGSAPAPPAVLPADDPQPPRYRAAGHMSLSPARRCPTPGMRG